MPMSAAGFGDLGGAVDAIFGAVGQLKSAKGYQKAAQFAQENASLAQQSTNIQQIMAQRKITQTVGGQQADIAGAGLANAGSALDIMRDSASQASLTKQLITTQGQINVLGYEAEAANYESMASAAKTAAGGGILGGLLKGAGAVMSIAAMSDDRLKDGVVLDHRRPDGLGIYTFAFKGSVQRFRGVLASEVEQIYPRAVTWDDGHRVVNYSMIGVSPEVVSA